jgi:phosphatidate cytidylyltransferase
VLTSNLLRRFATAGIIVPVLAGVLFFGPAWAWFGLVAIAVVISAMELFSMTHTGDPIAQAIHVVTTLGVSLVIYLFPRDSVILLTVLLAVPVAGMLVPLWRLGDIRTAGLRQMAGIGGPLYIGVALSTVAMLRHDLGTDGAGYVAMTLTFAWFGDTGAYFSGRYLGKAKLYPEISPRKTRAGFTGALVGASIGALLAHFWYLPSIPLLHAVGLAVVGGGMGQLGDLAESLLKRSSGMKDSGWILPGHGGLLDRVDALMIVGPIVYIYTLWAVRA